MEFERAREQAERPPNAECYRQVERILQSASFRNASTLQQLLLFLATRALDGANEPLKEYTIGVEAFGRMKDFDPKTDTIVRVQTHRLRQKLKEYYDSEGSNDRIVIEVPKGHYLPTFELPAKTGVGSSGESETTSGLPDHSRDILSNDETQQTRSKPNLASTRMRITLAALCALVAGIAVGIWIGSRQHSGDRPPRTVREYAAGTDPVKAFWANFIGDDATPVIAYPDAVFLLDDSNDLFRFRQGASDDRGALVDPHLARQFASNPKLVSKAGALYYENGYTGTGELQAVAMLSGLLGQMGVQPIVKPSRDITPVDLRQHSVILLGSSFQNVAVAQLMSAGDLTFKNPDSHLEGWRAEITNLHPQVGEEVAYQTERDPVTHALKMDYGIISVQSGVVPGRHIAVLGGLDTTGTEGATRFAVSETGAKELLRAAALEPGKQSPSEMQQFKVLVKVRLEKGYEVLGASQVTVHKIEPAGSQQPDKSLK